MNNADQSAKRLSVRRVAIMCGLPTRAVSRAVATGELPAVVIQTETGRNRFYISTEDAHVWLNSLQTETSRAQ